MGRMHRSLIVAVLILSLMLLIVPVSGAADLAFVAVDDTVPLTLSGDSLPFYSGGTLYVPYTAFNAASLSFFPSYDTSSKLLTLFSRSSRLVFDLSAGTVTDENKDVQLVSAISRGGMVYLPAAFCANHFGVQVSDLSSLSGYRIVRFTTGNQVYDDSLFVEKAENLISYRVSQYTAPAPSAPSTPPEPPITPNDPLPEEPEKEPPEIYLAITDASTMAQSLEILARYRQSATFFLTEAEILQNGDLIRQIAGSGHNLGLLVTGTDAAAELNAANAALDQVLKTKSLLALVPQAVDTTMAAGQYRIFSQPDTRLTASQAAAADGEAQLMICTADNLTASLIILEEADAVFHLLRETTDVLF